MTGKRLARHSALVAALCAGTFASSAAPATADRPTFTTIGVIHTFGDTCYGQADAGASSPRGTPGTARFGISFVNYTPFGVPCTFTAFANWRNLDTGAVGTVAVPITSRGSAAQPPQTTFARLPTGSGRVHIGVTTDYLHLGTPFSEIRIR
ncbi:hypothetical protein [Nocardia sp. CNY236]|uniref:hypothetical protein n=1 Tax=Nocardia sp. CNY236 TaxID=1169152 RepID=UPI0003F97614|nr:hypothetical protein [Nocardia sp. CNY236]